DGQPLDERRRHSRVGEGAQTGVLPRLRGPDLEAGIAAGGSLRDVGRGESDRRPSYHRLVSARRIVRLPLSVSRVTCLRRNLAAYTPGGHITCPAPVSPATQNTFTPTPSTPGGQATSCGCSRKMRAAVSASVNTE